jgi:hypothetical protein
LVSWASSPIPSSNETSPRQPAVVSIARQARLEVQRVFRCPESHARMLWPETCSELLTESDVRSGLHGVRVASLRNSGHPKHARLNHKICHDFSARNVGIASELVSSRPACRHWLLMRLEFRTNYDRLPAQRQVRNRSKIELLWNNLCVSLLHKRSFPSGKRRFFSPLRSFVAQICCSES